MSKINFSELNTTNGFKAFLSDYHQILKDERSFPPLGIQKALQTASKAFLGINSWHELSAQLDKSTGVPLAPVNTSSINDELISVATGLRDYIDAIPSDIQFDVVMPGVDRDWVDKVIESAILSHKSPEPFVSMQQEIMAAMNQLVLQDTNINLNDVAEITGLTMAEVLSAIASQNKEKPVSLPAKNDSVRCIAITTVTISADHERIDSIDTELFRDMEKARKFIRDEAYSTAMSNDKTAEELLDCRGIITPDEDDVDDLSDSEEVLEWILDNNNMFDLINLISYLDYDLTKITIEDKYI